MFGRKGSTGAGIARGRAAAGRRSEIGKWRDVVSLGALLEQKAFI